MVFPLPVKPHIKVCLFKSLFDNVNGILLRVWHPSIRLPIAIEFLSIFDLVKGNTRSIFTSKSGTLSIGKVHKEPNSFDVI